ncbi:MAG: preprotein translocase subunit YajC [Deltaproteobacteria bacterium]|nr:preprotein translocase subunit YajC [Deltaproteobacteria bacterium]
MLDLFCAATAWAEEGGAAANGAGGLGGLGGLLGGPIPMLVLMFVIFYFLLIRPQQKKAKAHKEMLGALKKGDNIITSGGVYGKITGITDAVAVVEIAPQVRIKITRGSIAAKAAEAQAAAPAEEKKK